jgi:hypothetical protein
MAVYQGESVGGREDHEARDGTGASVAAADLRTAAERRRWTLHGLNNGAIFRATRRGVGTLPVSVSYAIGHAGTWLAWRLMPATRAAVAGNLRALFPDASQQALERKALQTLRSYARDVIDFIRALDASDAQVRDLFEYRTTDVDRMRDLLDLGRGVIMVTGHYGNWELGSVAMRRLFRLPLTIVAMAEDDEEVNRIRREIRDALAVDTIEVRKSLDTALQIRRRLSDNQTVATGGRESCTGGYVNQEAVHPAYRLCSDACPGSGYTTFPQGHQVGGRSINTIAVTYRCDAITLGGQ